MPQNLGDNLNLSFPHAHSPSASSVPQATELDNPFNTFHVHSYTPVQAKILVIQDYLLQLPLKFHSWQEQPLKKKNL